MCATMLKTCRKLKCGEIMNFVNWANTKMSIWLKTQLPAEIQPWLTLAQVSQTTKNHNIRAVMRYYIYFMAHPWLK